jgi:hypothetical protein
MRPLSRLGALGSLLSLAACPPSSLDPNGKNDVPFFYDVPGPMSRYLEQSFTIPSRVTHRDLLWPAETRTFDFSGTTLAYASVSAVVGSYPYPQMLAGSGYGFADAGPMSLVPDTAVHAGLADEIVLRADRLGSDPVFAVGPLQTVLPMEVVPGDAWTLKVSTSPATRVSPMGASPSAFETPAPSNWAT